MKKSLIPLILPANIKQTERKNHNKIEKLLLRLSDEEVTNFNFNYDNSFPFPIDISNGISKNDFLDIMGKPKKVVKEKQFKNVYILTFYYIIDSIMYEFYFVGADAFPETESGKLYLKLVNGSKQEYCLATIKIKQSKVKKGI